MDNPRNKQDQDLSPTDWLTLLRENEVLAEDLPSALKEDLHFMLSVIAIDANSITIASAELQLDRKLILSAIQCGAEFKIVPEQFRGDYEILLEGIRAAGFCPDRSPFLLASDELKANASLALEAIKRDERAFEAVNQSLKFDRDFIIRSMQSNAEVFLYLSQKLKENTDFVLDLLDASHRIDISFLAHAPSTILASRDVIITAMQGDPTAYRYAGATLKYDRTILRLRH